MKRNTAFLTPNARITEAYLRMRESVEDGKPATDDDAKRQLEFWKKLEGRPAKYKVGDKVKNNGRRGNGRGLKGEIVDVIQFKGKRPGYTVKVDGLSGEQSWSEEEMEPQKKPRAKVRRPHKIKGDGSKKGDYIEAEFTDLGVSESITSQCFDCDREFPSNSGEMLNGRLLCPSCYAKSRRNIAKNLGRRKEFLDMLHHGDTPLEPCIETASGVIYFNYDPEHNELYYGSMSNTGILKDGKIEYDNALSMEQNVQNLVEEILEKYGPYEEDAED